MPLLSVLLIKDAFVGLTFRNWIFTVEIHVHQINSIFYTRTYIKHFTEEASGYVLNMFKSFLIQLSPSGTGGKEG